MTIEDLCHLFKECPGISTDSRKPAPGSIFFALKGENFDGNKFALDAVQKGCSFAVVDDPSLKNHPELIYFQDVLVTLQNLANYHRSQLKIPVIGITGSNGKTTTKELTAAILSRKYKVCATQGNLNNHIGVPLTLLTASDHDMVIIEMGANHTGEIAALCKIANPGFGIITNIGKAHLGGFGSPEEVIKAKTELYNHLAQVRGKVFVDSDNALLRRLVSEKNIDPVFYGNAPGSVCSGEISGNTEFLAVKVHISGFNNDLFIQTSLVGNYNLNNLLAAVCIGKYFGVGPEDITSALTEYVPSNNRSQLMVTQNNKIVNDAYNANPGSMESSISNFLQMSEDLPKMIILGDMLELGKFSRSEHQAIIEFLKSRNFSNVILVGPEFCAISELYSLACFHDVEELIEHFRSNTVKEHSILLKGSRGIKLEKLLDVL